MFSNCRTIALSVILVVFFSTLLNGQCEIRRLWTIDSIAPELEQYWAGVERVDFNANVAIFTRRDGNDCKIIACPPYELLGEKLVLTYGPQDTLKLELVSRGCSIMKAYRAETGQQELLFSLFASADNQCDFPEGTQKCGAVTPSSTTPTVPSTNWFPCQLFPLLDENGVVSSCMRLLFWIIYLFYLISFIVLRLMSRIRQSNYCWLILCVWTGLFSPFAFGPLIAFGVHLSIAVAYYLRRLTFINSIGSLFFYGVYSGFLALYEMCIRFGIELASGPDFMYFSVMPAIAFFSGLGLIWRVIKDAYALGFGSFTYNMVLVGVLYFGPYLYVMLSRAKILAYFVELGILG